MTPNLRYAITLDFGDVSRSLAETLPDKLELIGAAEAQGYHSVWVGESYSFGTPSPLLMLAALAPHTKLPIGTAALLLPTWQPLRLAHETAVLDQLCGGRLTIGLGIGRANLFTRWGLPADNIAGYVDDALLALKALWAGEDGFMGEHIRISGGIAVLPARQGGPELLIGGSIKRSVQRARSVDGYVGSTTYSLELLKRQGERYWELTDTGQFVINRLATVAPKAEEAIELGRRHIGPTLLRYARHGSLGPQWRSGEHSPADIFDALANEFCLVGTPNQVAEQLDRYVDAGVRHINLRLAPQGTPQDVSLQTIELFPRG